MTRTMDSMISLEEYRARLLERAGGIHRRRVRLPVTQAQGYVVAQAVRARVDTPGFDNSAMDGYAIARSDVEDVPATLPVSADIPAGSGKPAELVPGTAARIMTGAPVPEGADTIIPFEDTTRGIHEDPQAASTVTIVRVPDTPYRHIRRRGEDTTRGDIIADESTVVSARVMAGLIACGVDVVDVYDRPRLAVITTGAELVDPPAPLGPGSIYDSNGPLIAGLARAVQADLVGTYRATDTKQSLAGALKKIDELGGADIIVTTGGVSVGAFDVVRKFFTEPGFDVDFVKVAMQPGKPQGFGTTPSGALVICLPGNPVSAWVSFEAFVAPVIATLRGVSHTLPITRQVTVSRGWRKSPGRMQLMPVVYTDAARSRVAPATAKGSASHLVARMGLAQGLALVPPSETIIDTGRMLGCWDIVES